MFMSFNVCVCDLARHTHVESKGIRCRLWGGEDSDGCNGDSGRGNSGGEGCQN
jgi:hypothetical protein